MAENSLKLIPKDANKNHPSVLNAESKKNLLLKKSKELGLNEFVIE